MGRKSNYENGMYNQLMNLMNRMDSFEKESNQKIDSLNHRIDELYKIKEFCEKVVDNKNVLC